MRAILVLALTAFVSPASAATIYAADASKHVGETVTVEGQAHVHIDSSGVAFLDVGGTYPNNPFSAVIFASDASKFGNLAAYNGKTVDVTGKVRLYKGKPEIVLNGPSQLQAK